MRIKNKGRFIISMSIIFLILFIIFNMITTKVFSYEEQKLEKVIVSNGDTLWSIAKGLDGDINRNIFEIKRINNLEKSNLFVGQELLIPVNM